MKTFSRYLFKSEKLNVKPNEALVLEDSEAGIQAAYDANIPVICIPDMKYPQEKYIEKVENIYTSLDSISTYLENRIETKDT